MIRQKWVSLNWISIRLATLIESPNMLLSAVNWWTGAAALAVDILSASWLCGALSLACCAFFAVTRREMFLRWVWG